MTKHATILARCEWRAGPFYGTQDPMCPVRFVQSGRGNVPSFSGPASGQSNTAVPVKLTARLLFRPLRLDGTAPRKVDVHQVGRTYLDVGHGGGCTLVPGKQQQHSRMSNRALASPKEKRGGNSPAGASGTSHFVPFFPCLLLVAADASHTKLPMLISRPPQFNSLTRTLPRVSKSIPPYSRHKHTREAHADAAP